MAIQSATGEFPVWTTLVFTKLGSLSTGTNVTLALLAPVGLTVQNVRCYAKTAPTGTNLIVDINKNGSTIFTTQANRPTISAGQNKGNSSPAPDITSLVEGDVVTLDIDQIGSGTAGSDLTVLVKCKQ